MLDWYVRHDAIAPVVRHALVMLVELVAGCPTFMRAILRSFHEKKSVAPKGVHARCQSTSESGLAQRIQSATSIGKIRVGAYHARSFIQTDMPRHRQLRNRMAMAYSNANALFACNYAFHA
jgi:hypothetical protein